MRCTPASRLALSTRPPPSTLQRTAISGVVSKRSLLGFDSFRNPRRVMLVVAPGGRSKGPGQPSSGGGRLKNQAGNSSSDRYGRVMIAEHAGFGARQSARISQAWGAPACSLTYGRPGSKRTHQPCWASSRVDENFHASSRAMQRWASRVRRKRGPYHSRIGNNAPIRIASAGRSSGTPSKGPAIRSGHNSATAASEPQIAVI